MNQWSVCAQIPSGLARWGLFKRRYFIVQFQLVQVRSYLVIHSGSKTRESTVSCCSAIIRKEERLVWERKMLADSTCLTWEELSCL